MVCVRHRRPRTGRFLDRHHRQGLECTHHLTSFPFEPLSSLGSDRDRARGRLASSRPFVAQRFLITVYRRTISWVGYTTLTAVVRHRRAAAVEIFPHKWMSTLTVGQRRLAEPGTLIGLLHRMQELCIPAPVAHNPARMRARVGVRSTWGPAPHKEGQRFRA